jgi:sodium/proline symporter
LVIIYKKIVKEPLSPPIGNRSKNMTYSFVAGFLGYLGALGVLGALVHQTSHTASDFMLGGRSLNYWTTAIAAHASDMSLWMFMGLPALAYSTGLVSAWIPLGLILGMYATWKLVAAPLRIATEHTKSNTLSAYFDVHFSDTSGSLKVVSAFFSLWFFTFYIASGLVGMGWLFESAFHINYYVGILLGLFITVAYTFLGGFTAIAKSHFFQGIFLVIMMIIIPILTYWSLPAGVSLLTALHAQGVSFSLIPASAHELALCILLAISWGIGYFGQPHILVNFMGIKDPKTMPKAMRVGMLWQFFTFSASLIMGFLGIAFFTQPLQNTQLVFIQIVEELFPPFIAGCILCSIVAAGLTTIATQILVASSTVANDLYKHFINPTANQKTIVVISKYALIGVPLISFLIAFTKSSTVYNLVEYAWFGLGASFGPVIIAALYLPRASKTGILWGMIAGGATATLWPLLGLAIPSMLPAFLLNLLIIVVTRKRKNA